jgi:tetratricopeptide (TPR) repeat protein
LKAFSSDDALMADEISLRRLAMLVGYVAYGTIDNERIRRQSFERIGNYAAVDTMDAARKQATVAAFFDPDACQEAITLDPGFSPGYVCLATLLMLSPDADLIAQGAQLLDTARTLDPNNSDIYRTEAIAPLMHEKDYPEAERLLRKALELNPFSDQVPNALAWLLLVTGRVDESVAIYQRLLPLVRNSDPWTALVAGYQFGVAARTAGRHSELVQELEFESIVGEPHKLRMALALTELDDPRAQPMLDDLLLVWNEILPRQRDLLMLALQRSGRTAEAAQRHVEVATYAETTPATTQNTWALWGLTHYAVAEGNFDDAFKWLQLARANDPDFVLLVASLAYTRNQRYATLREDPRFAEVVKWSRTPLSARTSN